MYPDGRGLHPDSLNDGVVFWLFRSTNAEKAASARHEFVGYLRLLGDPDADYASAELVFGELVGNVARHAPGPIAIRVDWTGERPLLTIHDEGPGFDAAPQLPDPTAEGGRGLFLVHAFADDLAVSKIDGDGTDVSVRLRIEKKAAAAS